jgi:hypothetical protein
MHLTCTAWVEFLKIGDSGRGRIYRSHQNIKPLSLHDLLFTGRDLLSVSLRTSLKSNLCTILTTHTHTHTHTLNTTENNYTISHPQNMNSIQPNVFLTLIYMLLVTNKERSALLSTNKSQNQLQTLQSVSVRGDMNQIDVFEDSVQWRAVISTVINFWFLEIVGNSSTSWMSRTAAKGLIHPPLELLLKIILSFQIRKTSRFD